MEKFFIPILLGTAREDRSSENVAKFVLSEVEKDEQIETQLVDVRTMDYTATIPPWGKGGADEKPTKWKEIMSKADGLIIVTPEYNHGYPGELKLVLDSLYAEYEKKPVALCGVSSGGLGGARVVDHIKQVLIELKMVPIREALYFSNVSKLFDDMGIIQNGTYSERVNKTLVELIWYTKALKVARNK